MTRRLLPIIALLLFPVSPAAQAPDSAATPAQRAVLITGASSGIGRRTTELLSTKGFFVYAGARKPQDLAALSALPNVQGVRLDVTKPAEIAAAVQLVEDAGRGLYGLINNAGVLVLGPLIELRESDLDFQLDVNVYGPYRMTKAFAPLLIASKGRVMTTGSLSGYVTWPMGGPYTMSKHAVEAFSDVLAAELKPFGVRVSVIDPGNYKSRISTNMKERLLKSGYTTKGSRYAGRLDRMLQRSTDRSQHKEPDEVAQTFLRALTEKQPRRRYMVVPNRREADVTLRAAIRRLVELNKDQPYARDREGLIELLDEALRRQ